MDTDLQKWRGFLQGWNRGFYKDYDWELKEKCLDRTALIYVYHVWDIITNFKIDYFNTLAGLMYNVYYMVDYECNVEENLHDISCFCFDHDCRGETLLQNEMGKVF